MSPEKILFLNISQVIGNPNDLMPIPQDTDADRPLYVNVARNSSHQISHITAEFAGVRARYLGCFVFDGTGDNGAGLRSFAMPQVKLTSRQRALLALSFLAAMIQRGDITSNWEFLRERIAQEYGSESIMTEYARMCANSMAFLNRSEKLDSTQQPTIDAPLAAYAS